MKKVKIVHVEDRFHPEMGYQLNFTAKFHRKDVDMHIVCSNSLRLFSSEGLNESQIKQMDDDFEKRHNIKIHRLPIKYEKQQGYNLLMKGLLRKIHSLKPDVLFVHAMESYTAFQLLSKKHLYRRYLICTDTHTLDNQFKGGSAEKLYFRLFKQRVIKNLNYFNAPVFYTATENKNILLKKYGLKKEQIYPYLIGTDENVFYSDLYSSKILREKLQISDNKKIVLYAGKFNQPKSPHLIIEALNHVKDGLSDVCLLMIGGKSEPYYTSVFKATKIDSAIDLIVKDAVKVNELNAYYNMADVAVFPKENTLSALDAQLCELPVVMESDLTNEERLQKGGLTYSKGNYNELGKQIVKLLNDNELRLRLGKEGGQFILENYTYSAIIEHMEDIIINRLSSINSIQ